VTQVATRAAVLGLDLGTSRVKALLCAPDGTVLGRGVAGYRVAAPRNGWAETDPEQWWRAARAAVRAALGPAPAQVAGLAVVGQMHGLVLYPERAVVLRPAIVWLDGRSSAEVGDYLRLPADLRARLGNAPSAGMAGPILLWLSRHEPDAYRRARWMLQPKDWLRMRLTGEPATDPTDASGTLLFDLERDAWATDVAEALGLRTDLLPPILEPTGVAGHLLPAAAEQLGLPAGLPVATGAADTAASLLAAGLPGPDWALLTVGTGGQLIAPVPDNRRPDSPVPDYHRPDSPVPNYRRPDNSLLDNPAPEDTAPEDTAPASAGLGATNLFRAVGPGTYRLAGAQNVGAALDWVRRTLGASWDELYATAARPWSASTPVFLPYLAGERWAHRDSGGAWTGLTLAHGRDDLMRAALEGVAFLLRGQLDELRAAGCVPARVMLAGGGSTPPAWRQLLADALELPLYPAGTDELTARGAALIAAIAAEMVPSGRTTARSGQKIGQAVTAADPFRLAEAGYRRFGSSSSLPPKR
jgi:xylulokinase